MEPFTLDEAADAMDAQVTVNYNAISIRRVSTDSRAVAIGDLFVAIRGESMDGHDFVSKAFAVGAAAAVVDRPLEADGPLLVVRDTLRALGLLARRYRDRFDIPVIGVTGSVGKTSTREMIACALSGIQTLTSEKNYNNEIGVPMTLFQLAANHQAAILEMGMRGPGQIAELCDIARPTLGVITNVGVSHIELLGSQESIARAKGELIERLPPDGAAILPADDSFISLLRDLSGGRRVRTFGIEQPADVRAENLRFQPNGTSNFEIDGQPFTIRAPGVHHVINACAAAAVGMELGIHLPEISDRLADFRSPSMRMESIELAQGITLLNDAYNAAPDSMRAALQTLGLISSGRRKVAILGDMRELGPWSKEAHRAIGAEALNVGVDLLITVGSAWRETVSNTSAGLAGAVCYPDSAVAAKESVNLLQAGDIVLVKGSRALAMEQIVASIRDRFSA